MRRLLAATAALFLLAGPALAQASYDSGSMPAVAVVPANASHAAGVSVGGLISLSVARMNGGSGEIENFLWTSSGGDTGGKLVRLWDARPTNTTCTDNVAFAGSTADDKRLIYPPFSFTPVAPANTTGDAKTYGVFNFSPLVSFHNQDFTATQFVYACVVTTATDTADQNATVYVNATGPQN